MRSSAPSLELSPADVLVFTPTTNPDATSSATFTLRNSSASQPIAFLIKSTNPAQFTFQPPRGVIRAGASVTVSVTASKHSELSSEKILVQSIRLAKEKAAQEASKELDQAYIRDITHHKLLCELGNTGSVTAAMASAPPPLPTPPMPTTPRMARARSRSRSRSGESKASLSRTIGRTGSARNLEQLQKERQADEIRRNKLLTYRDDSVHNHRCFDCGDASERPLAICLDFSTFVCNVCSTTHRGLEHRVKSIKMTKFTDSEVDIVLASGGNAAAQAKWRKTYTPSFKIPGDTPQQRSHNAITLTFFQHAWTGEAPPPNMPFMPAPISIPTSPRRGSTRGNTGNNAGSSAPTPPSTTMAIPLPQLVPGLCKKWTWLQNVAIASPWTGDEVCVPTNPTVEKQLREKVSFIQKALSLPAGSNGGVFGGVNLLRNMDRATLPEADLFLALELMDIRTTGAREAPDHLEAYALRNAGVSALAHPLLLLALARSLAKEGPSASTAWAKDLLVCFGKNFTQASQQWMTDGDREFLQSTMKQVTSAASANAPILSPEELEWKQLQQTNRCKSDAMDELLKLVGLTKVKQSAIQLFKSAIALQKMTPELQRKNRNITLNYCFTGNPGTGKTTVAKLFARILVDSKMRRSNVIEICSPQQLKDDGAKEFKKKIQNAMGGVVFIDEAYELEPGKDPRGKPIMAELLLAAEELRHDLSIIIAGYEDDIQNKLYAHNEGLRSRFVTVQFDDFDESDLRVLWENELTTRGWVGEDESVCVIACRRLARGAGKKGFGNARDVRQKAEASIQAATARPDYNGVKLTVKVVDVIGERPSKNPKLTELLKEIAAKTGWTRIKERVRELVDTCDTNYERELAGAISDASGKVNVPAPSSVQLNRLFLGNPGTGKTTFASYYGRLLKHLHLLSNGDVVKKTAGDFVGDAVGQSQTKTNEILNQAKGKILIIDEAYNLNDNLYGKQVLDVLVEKIQGNDSDDIAVIMIGYQAQMIEMFRVQNAGLERRFAPEFAFFFDDYKDLELLNIFTATCAKQHVETSSEVDEEVVRYLSQQRNRANFGNAGAVEQLVKNAVANAMTRHRREKKSATAVVQLKVEDLASETVRRSGGGTETKGDPLAALDGLYRMDNIRNELSRIQKRLQQAQRDGETQPQIGHFVFRGSPGTGKTTVARAMGSILFRMGVLSTDRVVETSGLNMTGEYVGATKKKVEEQLQEARGAILFIDEAYEMGKGPYGEEALTTLVAAMTDPTYKGMVVIIAGYPHDLDVMMRRNAGLTTRFKRVFDFQDWELDDCKAFVKGIAAKRGFRMDASVQLIVHDLFKKLRELPDFGNGRDGGNVWDCLVECRAVRVCDYPETGESTIQASDAKEASEIILKARAPPPVPVHRGMPFFQQYPHQSMPIFPNVGIHPGMMNLPIGDPRFQQQFQQSQHHQPQQQQQQQQQQVQVEETRRVEILDEAEEPLAEKELMKQEEARDPGVSEEAWQELQKAKEDYQQLLDQMLQEEAARKEREEAERKLREYEELMQKMKEEAEERAREEAERKLREYEALLQQQKEEAERKAREEAERQRREYEALMARMKKEAADKKAREEAERKQREYEEQQRKIKEENERKAREEAERKRREYEDKLRREREEAERKARDEAERKRREHEAELERKRRAEEEARRVREEAERKLRENQAKQERLRQIGNCPEGYKWYQTGGGWRCEAGGHFVSDAELQRNFTF